MYCFIMDSQHVNLLPFSVLCTTYGHMHNQQSSRGPKHFKTVLMYLNRNPSTHFNTITNFSKQLCYC